MFASYRYCMKFFSNPINSTLQLMKLQLNILAFQRPSVHNLKSDFSLSFSFNISGVIYIGRWMLEVCVISVVYEMLFQPHKFNLKANEATIRYLGMPKSLGS